MKRKIRVLFIEASADIVVRVNLELQQLAPKSQIRVVANQQQFFEELKGFTPHLILANYQSPDFGGNEVLLTCQHALPNVPIIFLSETASVETVVECIKKGAQDFVLLTDLPRLRVAITEALQSQPSKVKTSQSSQAVTYEETHFRDFIEQISESIFTVDQQGIIQYISPAVKYAGYTPAEIVQHSIFDYVLPEEREFIENEFRKSWQNLGLTAHECRIKTKTGEVRWLRVITRPISDKSGTPLLLGTISDITKQKKMLQALAESEKMFRKMTDNISDGLIIIEEGKVKYYNQQVLNIFGIEPHELEDFDILKLAIPEERPRLQKIIDDAQASGYYPKQLECWIQRKDGTQHYIQNRYSYTRTAGKITTRYIITSDMTEHKSSEEIIRAINQRLEILLQTIPDPVYFKDTEGRYLLFNQAFEQLVGLPTDAITGKTDSELLPPALAVKCRESDEIVATSRQLTSSEEFYTDNDGNPHYYETKKVPLLDKNGNFVGIVGISRDITERKLADEKLRQIQQIYQRAIENARGVPYILNYDKKQYDFMGSGCAAIFDISPEELSYTKLREMTREVNLNIPNPPIDEFEYEKLILDGKIDHYNADVKLLTKEGKIRWFSDSAVPLVDEKTGKVWGCLGILQDITERKRTETLQKVLHQIANAVNQTSNLFELIDAIRSALNLMIDTTNFFVALYDEKSNTLTLPYFVDQKDKFEVFPAGKTLTAYMINHQKPLLLQEDKIRELHAAGEIDLIGNVPQVWMGVPIKIGEKVIGALVVQNYTNPNAYTLEDLTMLQFVSGQIGVSIDRKRSEIQIRVNEERFYSIFKDSPIGIALYNTQGELLEANRLFLNLLGIPEYPIAYSYNLYTDFGLNNDLKASLARHEIVHYEWQLDFDKMKSTSRHPLTRSGLANLYLTIAPVYTEQSVYNYLVQILDITDRKRLEEEHIKREKLDSIGVMATGIAHDFNNILTAILGNISLAKMYAADEKSVSERLNEAEKASLRARDLVQRLMTFTRSSLPEKKVTSLTSLLREAVSFSLVGTKTRCIFDIVPDLWAAELDEAQIIQVFNNIIINADQAMPDGGTLRISARNFVATADNSLNLTPGNYVCIAFQDEGIGIPPEFLSKIFDPYFSTKRIGSGLGLATAYSIVKKHGGRIIVHSVLNEGATFTVYLPAIGEAVAVTPESPAPQFTYQGRILLMDDDIAVATVARQMLESLGYSVEVVSNGKVAIAEYQESLKAQNPYKIVILDLTVPGGMGGKETIKHLLEIDPSVVAVVTSGYSADPILTNYEVYGFKGALIKPFQLSELTAVLNKLS